MFPPNARHQPDGSVTFPPRGTLPVCNVEGYEEDPSDPWKWIMLYLDCRHRTLNKPYKCNTGKLKQRDFCELKMLPCNPAICKGCPVREPASLPT